MNTVALLAVNKELCTVSEVELSLVITSQVFYPLDHLCYPLHNLDIECWNPIVT